MVSTEPSGQWNGFVGSDWGSVDGVGVLLSYPFCKFNLLRIEGSVRCFDIVQCEMRTSGHHGQCFGAFFILFAFSIPLYLLRIEPIPRELNWILTFFFVFFLFPAHLVVGWAWGRSRRNEERVHWFWRYVAWVPQLAVIVSYVGILYLAKFTSWEGGYVFLLQHTVLPPVPFFLR